MQDETAINVADRLPFLVRGIRVGVVSEIQRLPGFQRGRLKLDSVQDLPAFEQAVELAKFVETCDAQEYLESWQNWQNHCSQLARMQISIGAGSSPVESFSVESDWLIEWDDADTDIANLY